MGSLVQFCCSTQRRRFYHRPVGTRAAIMDSVGPGRQHQPTIARFAFVEFVLRHELHFSKAGSVVFLGHCLRREFVASGFGGERGMAALVEFEDSRIGEPTAEEFVVVVIIAKWADGEVRVAGEVFRGLARIYRRRRSTRLSFPGRRQPSRGNLQSPIHDAVHG